MDIKGITFVGTRTDAHEAMTAFTRDVLGLRKTPVEGIGARLFELPDGSAFAVSPAGPDEVERTIGFLVEDVDAAAHALREAGIPTDDEVSANAKYRYVHFWAPVVLQPLADG